MSTRQLSQRSSQRRFHQPIIVHVFAEATFALANMYVILQIQRILLLHDYGTVNTDYCIIYTGHTRMGMSYTHAYYFQVKHLLRRLYDIQTVGVALAVIDTCKN